MCQLRPGEIGRAAQIFQALKAVVLAIPQGTCFTGSVDTTSSKEMAMSGNLKQRLTRPSIWLRLVFMIVLAIAFSIAEIVIFAVSIFQFFATLFTRKPNIQLMRFGRNLACYLQQITTFMTFATDERPFPFSPWPDELHEKPLVVEKDKPASNMTEKAETVAEDVEAAKPKKPASRKTAAARKPRTPPKKDS